MGSATFRLLLELLGELSRNWEGDSFCSWDPTAAKYLLGLCEVELYGEPTTGCW